MNNQLTDIQFENKFHLKEYSPAPYLVVKEHKLFDYMYVKFAFFTYHSS